MPELGEWGVKLFDNKYEGFHQSNVTDSILDLFPGLLSLDNLLFKRNTNL